MSLPPTSVMFEPVTCMPSWISRYAGLSTKTVVSGYKLNAAGNVPGDPVAMAMAAGKVIGQSVSLEAYTLARYMQSEVGTKSVAERVAVAQDAINKVRYQSPSIGNVNNLLLYRQPIGHANRGYYGPIHSGGDLKAPYGRWAATSQDPTVANLVLAIAVLNGEIPSDFNKGANDQNGPEVFVKVYGMSYAIANVKSRATQSRMYWVGPLAGINHMRTMQYRTLSSVDPSSPLGKQLIDRAVTAVQSGSPNWTGLPICQSVETISTSSSAMPAIVFGDKGLVASIVGSVLAVGGFLAAAFAIRKRKR